MAKSRSLSWRLGVSSLVIVLPLSLFALMMVGWIAHDEREAERSGLIGDAHAFADTVEREINAYFLLSAALSHSKLLERGDLAGFTEQARETLLEAPGVKLIVSSADGDPVLSIPPEFRIRRCCAIAWRWFGGRSSRALRFFPTSTLILSCPNRTPQLRPRCLLMASLPMKSR